MNGIMIQIQVNYIYYKIIKYLQNTTFVIGNLSCLFNVAGSRNIGVVTLNFRDTRYTYMDNKWTAPSGGDCGGVICLTNTENIEILNNLVKQLDASGIFQKKYNSDIKISKNRFVWIGAVYWDLLVMYQIIVMDMQIKINHGIRVLLIIIFMKLVYTKHNHLHITLL